MESSDFTGKQITLAIKLFADMLYTNVMNISYIQM